MSQLVRRYVQYKNRNKARIGTYFPPMIRCSDFVTYTIYTNSFIFTKSVKELWIFSKQQCFLIPVNSCIRKGYSDNSAFVIELFRI